MIRDQLRKLPAGPRELRKFGLVVGGIFSVLAAWWGWRGQPGYPWLLVPALALIVLGLVRPGALKWVYVGWMALGLALGLVVSTVLLTLLFYLIVTPMGLLARLTGKDFLNQRRDPHAKTYWVPRRQAPKSLQSYEQQF